MILCIAQTYKSHVDGENERERMQEMHEQKMHYLHEFHLQQIHARDHRIGALEAEARAREAERVAGMWSGGGERAWRRRGDEGGLGIVDGGKERDGDGVVRMIEEREKEGEVWRLMGAAREEGDGASDDSEHAMRREDKIRGEQ